jgi:polyisoprenoid-binding protein YceI
MDGSVRAGAVFFRPLPSGVLMRVLPAVVVLLAALSAPAFAQSQSYSIDPSHTYPSFEASHLGISWWRGRFTKTNGKVMLDRAGKAGTVEVQIDAATLDFGHPKMTETTRGKDFFNVEQFPTISYKGSFSQFDGDIPTQVQGELTLLGVTKPVALTIVSFKCITHPVFKRDVCGADVHGSFNRSEFGMSRGIPAPEEPARLRIQVEAIRD